MKYLSMIRNNWKKCTFASIALGYGIHSLKQHYEITNHMTLVCNDVSKYANNEYASPSKHVLVIMNPAANKKKSEKLFKKYCEPVLHIAGCTVEIFKTNHIGHAKTFVENLHPLPDAIVVAGGDGTSSEVVTGLLRRNNDDKLCPIVLLPLGIKNEAALKFANLMPKTNLELLKSLPNLIVPMLEERFRYENVLKFDVIGEESNSDKKSLKSIYGLNKFSWGILRDIESKQDKYWYFGSLRHYAAALFNSFSSDLSWKLSADFVYTPPCPGCRNCAFIKKKRPTNTYFSKFLTNTASKEPMQNIITNEECTTEVRGHVNTSQLNIKCCRNDHAFYELETKAIHALTPGFSFIKHLSNITCNNIEPSLILKSRTIQFIPEFDQIVNTCYSIDGEEYDVRPVKITLVPHAIKIYC